MKTNRIEVAVTDAQKARIEREAAALGTSPSEYMLRAVTLLDAEDVTALEELRSFAPELNAALTRIHENLAAAAERSEKHWQEMERIRTPEYRDEVRRSIEKDKALVEAAVSLFGVAPPARPDSEAQPASGETADQRMSEGGRARSGVREAQEPWDDDKAGRDRKPTK
jgi:uncharacterized protein (DUF1778 family)